MTPSPNQNEPEKLEPLKEMSFDALYDVDCVKLPENTIITADLFGVKYVLIPYDKQDYVYLVKDPTRCWVDVDVAFRTKGLAVDYLLRKAGDMGWNLNPADVEDRIIEVPIKGEPDGGPIPVPIKE